MKRYLVLFLAAYGIGLATYPALKAQAPARRVIHPAKFPEMGLPYSPGTVSYTHLTLPTNSRV